MGTSVSLAIKLAKFQDPLLGGIVRMEEKIWGKDRAWHIVDVH